MKLYNTEIRNDNYLHDMINELGLYKELNKIKYPNTLFKTVLFIDNHLKGTLRYLTNTLIMFFWYPNFEIKSLYLYWFAKKDTC